MIQVIADYFRLPRSFSILFPFSTINLCLEKTFRLLLRIITDQLINKP